MIQNLDAQDYLTFAQVAKLVPGRPCLNTIYRWAADGVNGRKLRHVRCGGRLYTTEQWVLDFLAAQTDGETLEQRAERLGV